MIRTAKKRKIKKGKEHGGSPYRPKEWKTRSTLRHWPKEAGMNPPGDEAPGTGHEGSHSSWHRRAGPSGTAVRPCPWGTWWQHQREGRAWLEAQGGATGTARPAQEGPQRPGSTERGQALPNTRAHTGKAAVVCSQMAAEPPLQGRADQPHKGPSTHPKRSHSTDRSFWSARMWLKEFDSHNTHISYYFTLNIFFQTTYFESLAKPNPAVPTQLPPCLAELLKSGLTDKVEHHWRFQSPGPPQWPLLYSVRMPWFGRVCWNPGLDPT